MLNLKALLIISPIGCNLQMFVATRDLEFVQGQSLDVPNLKLVLNTDKWSIMSLCLFVNRISVVRVFFTYDVITQYRL